MFTKMNIIKFNSLVTMSIMHWKCSKANMYKYLLPLFGVDSKENGWSV